MPTLKKILEYLGWAFVAAIIMIVSFTMWGNRNGWEFDAVLSGSMEPVYNVGGLVVIRPVNTETLEVGDAISFKLPGVDTPICHRIIDIQVVDGQKYLQAMGDANESPDPNLVPITAVNGKAVFHTPYVGRLAEVKNLGASRVSVLGQSLPAAALAVLVMGLLFIGLTLKDSLEDIFLPSRRLRREALKKQNARIVRRKKIFRTG